MKKELKHRKDEPLCKWCDRIAAYYDTHNVDTKTFREIIGDVSIQSYIVGGKSMQEILLEP